MLTADFSRGSLKPMAESHESFFSVKNSVADLKLQIDLLSNLQPAMSSQKKRVQEGGSIIPKLSKNPLHIKTVDGLPVGAPPT